jgi:hypothetical protein
MRSRMTVVGLALLIALLGAASAEAAADQLVVVRAVVPRATTDIPLTDANVVVRHDGRVLGRGRTGSEGLALIQVPRVPSTLTVTVRDARIRERALGGTLTASVLHARSMRRVCVVPPNAMVAHALSTDPAHTWFGVPKRAHQRIDLDDRDATDCDADTPAGPARARSWIGDTATTSNGIRYAFDGLTKTGQFTGPWLQGLSQATGWTTLAFSAFEILNGVLGEEKGPSNGDVIADMAAHFEVMQKSIDGLSAGITAINAEVTQLHGDVLSGTLTGLVSDATPLVSQIQNTGVYLQTVLQSANQITCPDPSGCPTPQPTVAQVCPPATLLGWDNVKRRRVVPDGWDKKQHSQDPLDKQCIGYSNALYGPGGFVEQAMAANLSWQSLTTLADWVTGSNGNPGILQYTSMVNTNNVRFVDTRTSLVTASVVDYYSSLYQQLLAEVMAFTAAIDEPSTNVEIGLRNVMPPSRFASFAPTIVPPGTVVDSTTGLMWSTEIGVNAPCLNLIARGTECWHNVGSNAGFFHTATTLTPTLVGGNDQLPAITPTSTAPLTLNVVPGAVTPMDPLTVAESSLTAAPLSDWYAAGDEQRLGLFAGAAGPVGPWLRSAAGFSAAIFGPAGTTATVADHQFKQPGSLGWCDLSPSDCYTVAVSDGIGSCAVLTTGCASAALMEDDSKGAFDLENGTKDDPEGALAKAQTADNWLVDRRYCTDPDSFSDKGCNYGVFYPSLWDQINDKRGWTVWFSRTPRKGASGQPSECYFYSREPATPGTCPVVAEEAGHNGLLSQALIPGATS